MKTISKVIRKLKNLYRIFTAWNITIDILDIKQILVFLKPDVKLLLSKVNNFSAINKIKLNKIINKLYK